MENNKLFNMEGLLDIEDFIKKNDLKEITNPIFFNANKQPTSDGLLSNEIFGITKEERSGTFAYIDLTKYFLHPLVYKIWGTLDSKIKEIVHGTNTYKISSSGEFVEDPNGENGIEFIRKNIDKIKIRERESIGRSRFVEFINKSKKNMFIKKLIVIPAFYRDVNTDNGKISVGDINKLYNSVIISVRSLKESAGYGFELEEANMGRIQELLLSIYNYFGAGIPGSKTSGPGMPSKQGIIKRANLRKTTDYGSRLVISAPNLKVENIDDLIVDFDISLVPLASVAVNFYPYIIFYMRRFFENEFSSGNTYSFTDSKGKLKEFKVKDYRIEFSDVRLKKELDRFIHGTANRFIPIEIPIIGGAKGIYYYMRFKGYNMTKEEYAKYPPGTAPLLDRNLTWCDIIFMAANEISKSKMILITRYPIDTYYNQFITKFKVSSTVETEPMIYNNEFVRNYPKIREKDFNTNTTNKFIDTLNICNSYLKSIDGDYDGDQVSIKGIYSNEANVELEKQLYSKSHYIDLGSKNAMMPASEAIQSLYNLTLVLSDDKNKISTPTFKNKIAK